VAFESGEEDLAVAICFVLGPEVSVPLLETRLVEEEVVKWSHRLPSVEERLLYSSPEGRGGDHGGSSLVSLSSDICWSEEKGSIVVPRRDVVLVLFERRKANQREQVVSVKEGPAGCL
jgi:hypothetical protein